MDAVNKWKEILKTRSISELDKIIAEKSVFYSPVVFKPQVGKYIVIKYLSAAITVFKESNFEYINEIKLNDKAFLEFKCNLKNIEVNGIDYIEYDFKKIYLFKVFIRPQKALNQLWLDMSNQLSL